ncbi:MAG: hypothetical protein NZ740_07750 [Kiritimatiellae bacterium]|nr:hypothetical protein [Kiritimatiellia bacterium]MDW8458989.1 hypothetical protein [Verrucomicrobiota bacterium]
MRFALAVLAVLLLGGCDVDDDRDHIPAPGNGALFVENNTSWEIRVYVNGEFVGRVGRFSDRPFDLRPGVYRVVLDQKDTARNWRDDVDVITGRLTVLDVADAPDSELDVVVFFD